MMAAVNVARGVRALAVVLVLFYAALAALYIMLDASAALSLHPWFGLAYGLAGALPGLVAVAYGRPKAGIVALALFAALVVAAPALDLGPRKAFLREANRIRAGMTLAEVDQRMAAFERRDADGRVVYLHHFGPGDTDSVTVTFAEGEVVDVRVSGD